MELGIGLRFDEGGFEFVQGGDEDFRDELTAETAEIGIELHGAVPSGVLGDAVGAVAVLCVEARRRFG